MKCSYPVIMLCTYDIKNPEWLQKFYKETYFWKLGMNTENTVKTSTGKGNGTFSLRWIRVNGMVCLSWGLLFLVSC